MKKPKISNLTIQEQQDLIADIKQSSLSAGEKEIVLELVDFYDDLMEKLKSSKISINQLKEMLVGFKADNLKKLLPIR